MRQFARFVSMCLCLSMGLSLAACRKGSPKVQDLVVGKDDPWYDSFRFSLSPDKPSSDMIMQTDVLAWNGKICHFYNYMVTETFSNVSKLDIYSEQGEKENSVELSFPEGGGAYSLLKILPGDKENTVLGLVEVTSEKTQTHFAKIDITSGDAAILDPVVGKDGAALTGFASGIYTFDTYTVINTNDFETGKITSVVYQGLDFLCELDLSTINGVSAIRDCSYASGSRHAFMNILTGSGEKYVCEFDISNGQLINKKILEESDTNKADPTYFQFSAQGESLRLDSLGNIYRLDSEKNEETKVFENNWYSPDFYDFVPDRNYIARVISMTEDKVIMYFYSMDNITTPKAFGENFTILILNKAQTNPHAGKKIIEISAPLDLSFSDYLSRAIVAFNERDEEYQIRIWNKHNEGSLTGSLHRELDPEEEKVYTIIHELEGSQAPDLVLNIERQEAMKDSMLMDLSSVLEEKTKQMLFDNVLTAGMTGGKLYFIPVTIQVEGIVVKEDLLGEGKIGISFDEYDRFVEDKLSGVQPYDYPYSTYNYRNTFLLSCIDIKSAIEGDSVNFDSEQFRRSAEYAKIHFMENAADASNEIPYEDEILRPMVDARYVRIAAFTDYVLNCSTENDSFSVIGTPSVEGRGARFQSAESISIVANTDRVEGCKKFVNFLLSGSFINENSPVFDSICTNKEVMSLELDKITAFYNEIYDEQVTRINEQNRQGMVYVDLTDILMEGHKKISPEMKENFLKMLSNLSVYYIQDRDIQDILSEELQAYYAGDRTLDDTIKLINDRVTVYINEVK